MSPRRVSPRRPPNLGDDREQSIRDHLIATAADLIDQHGSAGLTVRDIARKANVADGALYNHFTDKEELLAHALHAHVETVMQAIDNLPLPGSATVEDNLRAFITRGIEILNRILPAFAGFLTQPGVIAGTGHLQDTHQGAPNLPTLVAGYLRAEQQLGRVAPDFNADAAATLIVGACHELTLPRILLHPSSGPAVVPSSFVDDLVTIVLQGINPYDPSTT